MKFEITEELRKKNFKAKAKKGKASFFEKYEDANSQEIPELLKKREGEHEAFKKRELKRKRKLKKAESKGIIFLKDIR